MEDQPPQQGAASRKHGRPSTSDGSGRKRAKCEHGRAKRTCKECKAIISNEQTKRAADAVVAAHRLQIEALGPQLATRARLAIEDEGARRQPYQRYVVELEDERGRCLDRVEQAQSAQLPPMAAASSPSPAAEQVAVMKQEDGAHAESM
jgi:hypothetical protein